MKDKIKKFWNDNKLTVLISLAIGIFLLYFKSILNWFGNLTLDVFLLFSHKFSNYYYGLIAENNSSLMTDYQLYLTILAICGFAGGYNFDLYRRVRNLNKDIKNILTELDPMENKLRTGKDEIEQGRKTEEDLNLRIQKAKADLLEKLSYVRKLKSVVITLSIVTSIVLFLLLSSYIIYSSVSRINNRLNNSIVILSADLSDKEIAQLKAQ